jgi:uncharacterized metal-binding protein YceD (DUF177 family)
MGSNRDFEIPFEGLNVGKHVFEFEITDAFFEELEYSIIQKGQVKVDFILDKKETMMVGNIKMLGQVEKECDRCTEPISVPVDIEHRVVFKFSEEPSEDEDLIALASNEFKIHTAPIFYEILTVELPSRTIHAEDECSEEMLELLEEYTNFTEEEEDTAEDEGEDNDPRWDALKNLN